MRYGNVWVACAACAVSACTGLPGSRDAAEREAPTPLSAIESGISAVSGNGPIWFAAAQPGLSAVANDYLFAGPMMVNREGARRQYLWFALATTVDRRLTGAPAQELESIVLVVDDTPMTFELLLWDAEERVQPYAVPFGSEWTYAARVTHSQLRHIASAGALAAYVIDSAGRSPTYEWVRGDPSHWLPSRQLNAELAR